MEQNIFVTRGIFITTKALRVTKNIMHLHTQLCPDMHDRYGGCVIAFCFYLVMTEECSASSASDYA